MRGEQVNPSQGFAVGMNSLIELCMRKSRVLVRDAAILHNGCERLTQAIQNLVYHRFILCLCLLAQYVV